MIQIAIYSSTLSPRLAYVLQWLFQERLQLSYVHINDISAAPAGALVISYGATFGTISIPDEGLTNKTGLTTVSPTVGQWGPLPTIFHSTQLGFTIPFDILSATFYLISRYEEYQPFTPDKHGRYPATDSILYKIDVLTRPIVDEWIHSLRKLLLLNGCATPQPSFAFRPTYDIDMAYSHLHKGFGRIAGAYFRALLRVDLRQIAERTKVLKKRQKDPYDCFKWLRQTHKEYGYLPLYFVLGSLSTTPYDKNIHPQHPAMVRVIKNLVRDGDIGIHPSYYCQQQQLLASEKELLEQTSEKIITESRQHYIRLKIPSTYKWLQHNNIKHDYSLGYGTHLGFRAGTGSSYMWYDLELETVTTLRVHPFCFMDTTAFYEEGLSVSEAFTKLYEMAKQLNQAGSVLVTVFHNFSLGTDVQWQGWRQAYEQFLAELSNNSFNNTSIAD